METQIIRKTESRCPVCCRKVKAAVVERNGKIFLDKYCPQHKLISILVSEQTCSYKDLENFYFSVMKDNLKIWAIEIDVTFRCNMDCPICAWGREFKKKMANIEPLLDEIKQFLKKNKISVVRLSGGEPTCRDDLTDIIRMVKSLNKRVVVNTNGLKLADLDYVRRLKKAGVDSINLTLDGFDAKTEEYTRGKNYLSHKIRALNNLKQLNIPTGLNVHIIKGMNEAEIPKIIDYAARNKYIKLLSFGTVGWMGNALEWTLDKYLMPDQLIDIVVEKTSGKLSRDSIRLFQKLFIAINSFFAHRWCFYDSASFIVLRVNGTYESLEKYIDLKSLEKTLDKYSQLYQHNPFLARLFLFSAVPASLKKIRSFRIFKEMLLKGISFFLKSKRYLATDSLLYLSINTSCDNYKMDYRIAQNCTFAMAFKHEDNVLRFRGSASEVCDKLLNSEK